MCEYVGELLDLTKAKEREERYKMDPNIGSYMFYFKKNGQDFWYKNTHDNSR